MFKRLHQCTLATSFAFVALFTLGNDAIAQDTAVIKRDTQLRQTPSDSGKSMAALTAQSTVTRTNERKGPWVQVQSAQGTVGWVHMFDIEASTSSGGNSNTTAATGNNPLTQGLRGLGAIFGGGKSSTVATSTAGSTGWQEGNTTAQAYSSTNNAAPQSTTNNPATIRKMEAQRASAAQAQRFARSGGLQARSVPALPIPPAPQPEALQQKPAPKANPNSSSPANSYTPAPRQGFDLMESGN